jgi:hypothetical protein
MRGVKDTVNITRNNNQFEIQKQIDNKIYYYGSYPTIEEARIARNFFRDNGWPKHFTLCYYSDYNFKYVYLRSTGSYCIQKLVNGKIKFFGRYNSLNAALEERDFLIRNNWEYPDFESIDDTINNECVWLGHKVGI